MSMKTASAETRALVVKAYASGVATRKQLADIFGYHIQSIGNWIRAFEREERIAPHAKGHRKSVFSEEEKAALVALLRSDVDMTLEEIREIFGKTCTLSAIHRLVVKLGFVFKKNAAGKRVGTRRYSSEPE
jgi:transposase